MYIHIPIEEFEEELQETWKAGLIKNPHIDYATNAIHGWFEDKDVIVFKFKNYGFIHDNRFSEYRISHGSAGVTIQVINCYKDEKIQN